MNEVPVPIMLPPDATLYQLIVPNVALAPNTTVPASQRDPGVVELIRGVVFTVAVTGVLAEVQVVVPAST